MGDQLTILDNFSSGTVTNVRNIEALSQNIQLIKGDCKNPQNVKKALSGVRIVYHFAGDPEVKPDRSDSSSWFYENIFATHVLLEQLKNFNVEKIVFASSSTVYGDAKLLPTPESYGPLVPISVYGASKLAAEGLISAYCHSHSINAVILRFANIVGRKNKHGVISDFLKQIQNKPRKFRILGDGTQTKSFLHIDDCISAILDATQNAKQSIDIFNVGSDDRLDVATIARIALEEAGLDGTKSIFSQMASDGRGWNGDVKNMLLDTSKLRSTGWRPRHTSEQAVRSVIRSLLDGNNNEGPHTRSLHKKRELVSA